MLTHDAVRASALATSARLGVTAADHWLACLPLSHVGGLSVVTRAMVTGTPLTVLPGFDARRVEWEAGRGATLVSLVPTALAADRPERLPHDRARRRPPARRAAAERRDDVRHDRDRQRRRVRRPCLSTASRCASTTTARSTCGGRCCCGPTGTARDPRDPDGWLPTGDVGSWAPDGRLVVHGRAGDLIITGGENVWPEPVEAVDRRAARRGRRRRRRSRRPDVGSAGGRLRRARRPRHPTGARCHPRRRCARCCRPTAPPVRWSGRRTAPHGARQGAAAPVGG